MNREYYVQAVRSAKGWTITEKVSVPGNPTKYSWVALVDTLEQANVMADALNTALGKKEA